MQQTQERIPHDKNNNRRRHTKPASLTDGTASSSTISSSITSNNSHNVLPLQTSDAIRRKKAQRDEALGRLMELTAGDKTEGLKHTSNRSLPMLITEQEVREDPAGSAAASSKKPRSRSNPGLHVTEEGGAPAAPASSKDYKDLAGSSSVSKSRRRQKSPKRTTKTTGEASNKEMSSSTGTTSSRRSMPTLAVKPGHKQSQDKSSEFTIGSSSSKKSKSSRTKGLAPSSSSKDGSRRSRPTREKVVPVPAPLVVEDEEEEEEEEESGGTDLFSDLLAYVQAGPNLGWDEEKVPPRTRSTVPKQEQAQPRQRPSNPNQRQRGSQSLYLDRGPGVNSSRRPTTTKAQSNGCLLPLDEEEEHQVSHKKVQFIPPRASAQQQQPVAVSVSEQDLAFVALANMNRQIERDSKRPSLQPLPKINNTAETVRSSTSSESLTVNGVFNLPQNTAANNDNNQQEDNDDDDNNETDALLPQSKQELAALIRSIQMELSSHNHHHKDDDDDDHRQQMKRVSTKFNLAVDEYGFEHVFDATGKEITIEEAIDLEEDDWHSPFNESTYTMLYMCKAKSQAFWYGLFVYFLQVATIGLTLIDIIDWTGGGNPLQIPPMVDLTVTCSQSVTLFLALAYQSDLIEAVLKLKDGFYPEVLEKHPGATYPTWLFSCLAQLVSGLLLLTVIFVLTMQADDVISIMLNFAALHFMAEIDDLGFRIAKLGFVTNKLKFEAMQVCDFKVPKRKQNFASYCVRRVVYLITLFGIFFGYSWLKSSQLEGKFLQTFVYVQFDDAYNAKIPYYSGILSSRVVKTKTRRQYKDIGTQTILLAYCSAEKSWTFSETNDPCNYFAKSRPTRTYDVTTIPDSEWQIQDSYERLQPFQSFSLVGRDCDPNICQGSCVEQACICPHDRFGLDCEFDSVCPEIVLDRKSKEFPALKAAMTGYKKDFSISDEFHLLVNETTGEYVRAYNMPVYYSNKTYPANIIFFGGRRWILTHEGELFSLAQTQEFAVEQNPQQNPPQIHFPQMAAAVLENKAFHAHYNATFRPMFLSDPVDFETPKFKPTPAGLGWWTVTTLDEEARIFASYEYLDTILTCQSCDLAHGGFGCDSMGGTCNVTTGLCDCNPSFSGIKCEVEQACYDQSHPCYGDGVCDKNDGVCRCNLPWHGSRCEVHYLCFDEYGGCLNGGECNYNSGVCDCPPDPGLAGYACEKKRDCRIYGCEHGGSCSEENGLCSCVAPYEGVLCSMVNGTVADTSQCGNNGTLCSSHAADFLPCDDNEDCDSASYCNLAAEACTPIKETSCKDTGCSERGFCNSAGLCECPSPFTGPFCDYIISEDAT